MTQYVSPSAGAAGCPPGTTSPTATSPATGQQPVVPGPVRDGRVPPFREIMVVETRKVYDFCFQEDTLERCFTVPNLGAGAQVLSCQISNVTCQEITPREPIPDQPGLSLVSVQVNLQLTIQIRPDTGAQPGTLQRVIAFPKRLVLCAPQGTDVTCDVRGTCICTLQPVPAGSTEPNLCCTIQLCTTTQATADVRVLVPTFGTVVPQPCAVSPAFGGCPPMPPQVCAPSFVSTPSSTM